MYIRTPHYVASYFRNRNEQKPLDIDDPVNLEDDYTLYEMLLYGVSANSLEYIYAEGCFCERMWRKMLRGRSLILQNGFFPTIIKRNPKDPLSVAEIRTLCQLHIPKNKDVDDYLCIKLPPSVIKNGRQLPVDGQYQLVGSDNIRSFQAGLRRAFWNACIEYIDDFKLVSKKKGYERSKMEGLERFMIRYNIYDNQKKKNKETLKRTYYRQLNQRLRMKYDYTEYGETTSKDNTYYV